jgi:hypothetical protein
MTAAWDGYNAALAEARAALAAAAPDADTAAEAEAYLMRVTASTLADGFLKDHLTEGGLGRALPTRGGPNPDYRMCGGGLDPRRRYRLEGRLNASERVGVGLYALDPAGGTLLTGYAAFDRNSVDANGGFTLEMAPDASGPGALAISPDTRVLVIRVLHRNDGPAAGVRLEGAAPAPAFTPAMGGSEAALAMAGRSLLGGVRQFLEWSELISASPNTFTTPPAKIADVVRGDPDTGYYFGYYRLQPGEWLEATIPAGLPGYWSLHAYNHWCEALPGAGVHDLSAKPDADGRLRVRIGPDAPAELPNRVDTLGRRRGVLIFRTHGEPRQQAPTAALRRA